MIKKNADLIFVVLVCAVIISVLVNRRITTSGIINFEKFKDISNISMVCIDQKEINECFTNSGNLKISIIQGEESKVLKIELHQQ